MENNNRRKLGTYQICLIALAIVMNEVLSIPFVVVF